MLCMILILCMIFIAHFFIRLLLKNHLLFPFIYYPLHLSIYNFESNTVKQYIQYIQNIWNCRTELFIRGISVEVQRWDRASGHQSLRPFGNTCVRTRSPLTGTRCEGFGGLTWKIVRPSSNGVGPYEKSQRRQAEAKECRDCEGRRVVKAWFIWQFGASSRNRGFSKS